MTPPNNPALSLLTLQWPSALMLVIAGTLIIAMRYGRPTAQALTAATLALALLHALAWWAYGSANSLHALCSTIGLGLILPIVLRSRRVYPLAAGAAALLAVVALGCATLLAGQVALAAQQIAAMANAVLVLALWTGIASDWRRSQAPFRASQPNNQPQQR
jgi:hypothetical protein